MENVTVGQLMDYVSYLIQHKGFSVKEVMDMPIYLSDDDELNGVHTCFGVSVIEDSADDKYIREMINDNCGNIPLADNKKALLL